VPARGERFRVRVDELEPKSERSGLRGSLEVSQQVLGKLAEMEQEHFDVGDDVVDLGAWDPGRGAAPALRRARLLPPRALRSCSAAPNRRAGAWGRRRPPSSSRGSDEDQFSASRFVASWTRSYGPRGLEANTRFGWRGRDPRRRGAPTAPHRPRGGAPDAGRSSGAARAPPLRRVAARLGLAPEGLRVGSAVPSGCHPLVQRRLDLSLSLTAASSPSPGRSRERPRRHPPARDREPRRGGHALHPRGEGAARQEGSTSASRSTPRSTAMRRSCATPISPSRCPRRAAKWRPISTTTA
jgi:hypothetical protein